MVGVDDSSPLTLGIKPLRLDFSVGILSLSLMVACASILLWRKRSKLFQPKSINTSSRTLSKEEAIDDSLSNPPPVALKADVVTLTVLFGTQTGTAQSFAQSFADDARSRYCGSSQLKGAGNEEKPLPLANIIVSGLDEYGKTDAEYESKLATATESSTTHILVLFLATYGDGEPTDDAMQFFNWIKREAGRDDSSEEEGVKSHSWFRDLQFAVFGLGNRQYEHFNAVGITMDRNLSKLGGHRLVPLGKGDDDQCQEDDFNQWKSTVWPALDAVIHTTGAMPTAGSSASAHVVHQYDVLLLPEDDVSTHDSAVQDDSSADVNKPRLAKLMLCRELHTSLSDRSCIHVELDLNGTGLQYNAGDHVAIFPENDSQVVEKAALLLGLDLSLTFKLTLPAGDSSLPAPFPGPCSLRTALSSFADLLSSPKKAALVALALHAQDPAHAASLNRLASPEGKEEYQKWIVESHRSLLEVMEAHPSCKPPLGLFFATIAPRLQPRFYSISSSPRFVDTDTLHITCAVVRETTPAGRVHRGVCSTWMQSFMQADRLIRVPLYIRPSNFRLPSDPLTPVVMVGPGTGIAPFRAFLQDRSALLREGRVLGPCILFFGCRDRHKDHIYKEELDLFLEEGVLSSLHVAFSREGESKQYVQHLLQAKARVVWDALSGGGHFYVCGDAKAMAKDVHKTLINIVQQREFVSMKEAEAVVHKMQMDGRYVRDVW